MRFAMRKLKPRWRIFNREGYIQDAMEYCVIHDKSTRYVMKAVELCWKSLAGSVFSKSDRRYREDTMKQDQFCFYRKRRKSHRLGIIRCLV